MNEDVSEISMVWQAAVGRKIAQHTRAIRIADSTLVVEVEDSIWQSHLTTLQRQILQNLGHVLGPGQKAPTAIDFVVQSSIGSKSGLGKEPAKQEAELKTASQIGKTLPVPEMSAESDLTIMFSPDCSARQVQATLAALADYYRAGGGVGFEIDFELEDLSVSERVYA